MSAIRKDAVAMLVLRLAQAHYDVPTLAGLTRNPDDWTFGDGESERRAIEIAAHIREIVAAERTQ